MYTKYDIVTNLSHKYIEIEGQSEKKVAVLVVGAWKKRALYFSFMLWTDNNNYYDYYQKINNKLPIYYIL